MLFPVCLFLSAMLLFSIQPMAAKALLPIYGGTPAVWTVCMLYFQTILLLAYGYVVLLGLCKRTISWRLLHSGLMMLSLISFSFVFHPLIGNNSPEWSILTNLFMQTGLPLLVIGASAPLLQFAYSQTDAKNAADPYFLYSASNLGSLIALLFYPWVIERYIGLTSQFHLWGLIYLVYIALLFFVLFTIRYHPLDRQPQTKIIWPWFDMLYWVLLSFVPCSLMLGLTLYITTDVAATPLFWVIPLALYLLTFIFAFTPRPILPFNWLARNSIFFLMFTVLGFILNGSQIRIWQVILFNLLSFFVFAALCHRQLFLQRPKLQLLPVFYFCLALGGVLAGLFNGLIAPHCFNQVYEYPLALLLCLLVLPSKLLFGEKIRLDTRKYLGIPFLILGLLLGRYLIPDYLFPAGFSSLQIGLILALVILVVWQRNKISLCLSTFILFIFIFVPSLQEDHILAQERNFYGVKKVIDKKVAHALLSQSTVHGLQLMNSPPSGYASYYGALEPLIKLMQQQWSSMPVTVIGLGIGTIACQFRKSDQVNMIEIDEQVIDLANNSSFFTYMRDCPPKINILHEDGRLAVEKLPDASQKLLIVDAFSSDAIPVHLLTLEAFSLYKQKITPDGVILVNLSNRHLNLLPVPTAAGRTLDLLIFSIVHHGEHALGQFDSQWVLLTMNEELAMKLSQNTNWRFVAGAKEVLWTDDYSNLIPLLKL